MDDKYDLNRKQSVFLAKKLIADTIYCGIKLQGSKMTFSETQTILDGVNVPGASLDDIQTILDMRNAWKYVLCTLDEVFTFDYICKVNFFVARNESLEWGVLRTENVVKSGIEYIPPVPEKEIAEMHISELLNSNTTVTEKAMDYFIWGAKSQLFWDGNKRTSLICANKLLLQHGKGLFDIKDSNIPKFNRLLTSYYEETSGNEKQEALKNFLYESSIRGITFQNEMKEEMMQDRAR